MGDEEELKVSKKLLKTLTVDTRTDILKNLEKRPMTASELSRKLGKHVTTISEHLNVLKKSDLVERVERPGRKWIYYKLTKPGQRIIHPTSYRFVFVFVVAFFTFVGGYYLFSVDAYPGHWLYGLDRSLENIQLILTPSNLERAKLHIQRAEERLEETKSVVEGGETSPVKDIMSDYEAEITQARKEIEIAKQKQVDVIPVLEVFSESAAKQTAILENIVTKTPEVVEDIQPALNVSEESRATAVAELVNITGKT